MSKLTIEVGKTYLSEFGHAVKIFDRVEIIGVRGSTGFVYRGDDGGLYIQGGGYLPPDRVDVKGNLPTFDLVSLTVDKPTIEVGRTYRSKVGNEVKIERAITTPGTGDDSWYYKLGYRFRDSENRPYRENGSARIYQHEHTTCDRDIVDM